MTNPSDARVLKVRLELEGIGDATERARQLKQALTDLGLAQFSDRFEGTVERLVAAQSQEAARFQSLQDEIAALRAEFRTYRLRGTA
jgi:ABC-type phosphate transport system auxiliary subunit